MRKYVHYIRVTAASARWTRLRILVKTAEYSHS